MASLGKATVGQQAPDFICDAIVDGRTKEISLSCYTGANHWLVLMFFPRAWSFICPTEIRTFSARLEEFVYTRGCAVVFASTDSEYCLRAWNNTSELDGGLGSVHVPLVSDKSHKLSRDYGVLIEDEGAAHRALFIIDPKGILRAMSVNDTDIARSVTEVQRMLDALSFVDEFGEGCPVDWKKGDKGVDMSAKPKNEGRLEIKKSWTDWARPKMQRAWSGTTQSSPANSKPTSTSSRFHSLEGHGLPTLSSFHTPVTPHSDSPTPPAARSVSPSNPVFTPTSHLTSKIETNIDNAVLQMKLDHQKLENVHAAIANARVRTSG